MHATFVIDNMSKPNIQATTHELEDELFIPIHQRVREFTPRVLFMTLWVLPKGLIRFSWFSSYMRSYLSITAWNYGYDIAVFSGVQAMPRMLLTLQQATNRSGDRRLVLMRHGSVHRAVRLVRCSGRLCNSSLPSFYNELIPVPGKAHSSFISSFVVLDINILM